MGFCEGVGKEISWGRWNQISRWAFSKEKRSEALTNLLAYGFHGYKYRIETKPSLVP